MALNIIEGLETTTRAVKAYVYAEKVEGGFLEDVKTIIVGPKSNTPVDPPCVWIIEHEIVPYDASKGNLSQTNMLKTPFEFVCVDYDPDPEIATAMAKNLATRVCASVLKNFNILKSQPTDPNRVFQFIHFNTLIPDGNVDIAGKSDGVPAAALILDFVHPINWLKCKTI